jgi:hypothetical protein
MKNFLKKIHLIFEREDARAMPLVHKKEEIKDPVYHFFFHEKSRERKRVFDRALKAADEDQKKIIHQYELRQKEMLSA